MTEAGSCTAAGTPVREAPPSRRGSAVVRVLGLGVLVRLALVLLAALAAAEVRPEPLRARVAGLLALG